MSNPTMTELLAAVSSRRRKSWTASLPRPTAILMVIPLVILVLLFVVYPLVKLTVDAFTEGEGGFSNFAAVFASGAIRNSMINTMVMSIIVTALCLILGGTLAWILATPQRGWVKGLVWAAVLLPFWMGVVVKTYAWAVLLAKNGVINSFLISIGMIDEPLSLLYTPFAVILGMTYTMLPYAVLAMYPTISGFNLELINSARILGSSRTGAMLKIWLPSVMPGLVAAAAIVFAISIGFYITPVLLGGAQVPFMASVIGDDIFSFFNYPRAAASSVVLLAIALVVLLATLRSVGAKALKGGLGG
ncbi:ABC transporter permease [Leucobacter denitrificans]|uniref:ABC transporter permease n=2 Tax=Leucobacter denitrificans TaxID=683042 RepID=A0A7G9S224_9MICO|nr:ABC transporter permease [Leucobacter denitrificans]QNN61899.1 ABC transporter permease [Leucobacter denitrificans]